VVKIYQFVKAPMTDCTNQDISVPQSSTDTTDKVDLSEDLLTDNKDSDIPQKNADIETSVETDICPSEKITEDAQSVPFYTCNGKRPFVNAMEQYVTLLNTEIQNAKAHLATHPKHKYAKLHIRLFDMIHVHCTDQFGNEIIKSYITHEVHYGPRIRVACPPDVHPKFRKWNGFFVRYNLIWPQVNEAGKLPGGDGTGKNGTACSPFRDAQVRLLKEEGLFLIDASDIFFDQNRGTFRYYVNIRLYRSKPEDGPFKAAHGYGYIPGLGSAKQSDEKKSPNPDPLKSLTEFPPLTESLKVSPTGSSEFSTPSITPSISPSVVPLAPL
jgi:hypothetical protein